MSEPIWTRLAPSHYPEQVARLFADTHFAEPRQIGPVAGMYDTGGGGHWTFGLVDGTARYELTCSRDGTWTVKRYRED